MIRGGPSTLSGRQTEVIASRLMGTDSVERTLQNVRTRAKLTVKWESYWEQFRWLSSLCGKNLSRRYKRTEAKQNRVQRRQAGLVTNHSHVKPMTKLRWKTHDTVTTVYRDRCQGGGGIKLTLSYTIIMRKKEKLGVKPCRASLRVLPRWALTRSTQAGQDMST